MSLLEAIRESCTPAVWSRGVQIAREGKVIADSVGADEAVLRVRMRPDTPPFTVHLWPGDEEWSCDCPTATDACVHAAAAAIAWSQGAKGKPLAAPSDNLARVGYRMENTPRGLVLRRVSALSGSEAPLRGSVGGHHNGGNLLVTEGDIQVEQAMGGRFDRVIPRELAGRVLEAMEGCPDVQVDGRRLRANGAAVVPRGRVDDDNEGFKLRVVRDPAIEEVYAGSGMVRCGDELRPISRGGLSQDQMQVLSRGIYFGPAEVGKLVAETLPELEKLIPIDARSPRLPSIEAAPPRLVVETNRSGEVLVVVPRIVYGDPPTAHVERGQLVLRGGTVPIRDLRAEDRLARRSAEDLNIPVGLEARFRAESAVKFVEKLNNFSGAVLGQGWKTFKRVEKIEPKVVVEGDRISVDWDGVDEERLLRAWMEGAGMVPLLEGGWAPLPEEWLQQHGHRVFDLLAAQKPTGKVPRYALFDLARLCEELNEPPPPQLQALQTLAEDFEGIPVAPLPKDLTAQLRVYQRKGVDWLCFLRKAGMGGILADDMGLGKTLQALCAIEGRALVVAPTSVLHNWDKEIRRFRPGLSVCLYHGPRRELDKRADITLTSYALLRQDMELLTGIRWGTVILDEAQAIKNPESQVARAAFKLQAPFRLTLTGTPVENRLEELWSQFHFLNPGLLSGRKGFQDRYARPIAAGEPGAAERLRERIRPFVLRRLKREVAPELPPRTDITLRCTLSQSERVAYDTVRAAAQEEVVRQLGGSNVMAVLEALLRLRQAACHTALLPGHDAETSSKVELLLETLEEILSEGHKSLVFSQWTAMLDLIEPHLRRLEIPFVRLDGSTRDRASVVERFQSPDGPPVFLISLKAGGTGLNLTAADHVFLVDPWWNPAVEDQAADRTHRIGQDQPVIVYRLVAEDTVEERILALQEHKRALAEAALGGADQATSITREELLALLE